MTHGTYHNSGYCEETGEHDGEEDCYFTLGEAGGLIGRGIGTGGFPRYC